MCVPRRTTSLCPSASVLEWQRSRFVPTGCARRTKGDQGQGLSQTQVSSSSGMLASAAHVCKRLCCHLIFVFIYHVAGAIRLQHLHWNTVILQNCHQSANPCNVLPRGVLKP